jgi:transcriptional regulator with XRE-family HTH domain
MHTGEYIQKLRKLKGITQEELAEKINMKRGTYAKKEQVGNYKLDEIEKIAEVLQTTAEEIINNSQLPGVMELARFHQALLTHQVEIMARLRVLFDVTADIHSRLSDIPEKTVLRNLEKMVEAEQSKIWADKLQS